MEFKYDEMPLAKGPTTRTIPRSRGRCLKGQGGAMAPPPNSEFFLNYIYIYIYI